MGMDRWGHETWKVDGVDAITDYYSENDGWAFMRKGPERSLCVEVHDKDRAERALRARGYMPRVLDELLEQLFTGKNELRCYIGKGWATSKEESYQSDSTNTSK